MLLCSISLSPFYRMAAERPLCLALYPSLMGAADWYPPLLPPVVDGAPAVPQAAAPAPALRPPVPRDLCLSCGHPIMNHANPQVAAPVQAPPQESALEFERRKASAKLEVEQQIRQANANRCAFIRKALMNLFGQEAHDGHLPLATDTEMFLFSCFSDASTRDVSFVTAMADPLRFIANWLISFCPYLEAWFVTPLARTADNVIEFHPIKMTKLNDSSVDDHCTEWTAQVVAKTKSLFTTFEHVLQCLRKLVQLLNTASKHPTTIEDQRQHVADFAGKLADLAALGESGKNTYALEDPTLFKWFLKLWAQLKAQLARGIHSMPSFAPNSPAHRDELLTFLHLQNQEKLDKQFEAQRVAQATFDRDAGARKRKPVGADGKGDNSDSRAAKASSDETKAKKAKTFDPNKLWRNGEKQGPSPSFSYRMASSTPHDTVPPGMSADIKEREMWLKCYKFMKDETCENGDNCARLHVCTHCFFTKTKQVEYKDCLHMKKDCKNK